MDIKLSPKKDNGIVDIVHNSANTTPEQAKKILNTTPVDAVSESYFNYLVENFAEIKASWEQQMKEAHEGKVLVINKENAEQLKSITEFLKTKGGEVEVKPDLSFEVFNVSVTAIFRKEFSLNADEIDRFAGIIHNTANFEMDSLPREKGMRVYFVFPELGKYTDMSGGDGE